MLLAAWTAFGGTPAADPVRANTVKPRCFTNSTGKVWSLPSGTNLVRLNGKSFCDDTGPFLGLGVSYFQALRDAKYDRARLNHNLELIAAKGFNYVRVLSMVSWEGLEIVPVSFTNRAGHLIQAWPDYWQQFRDLLDLVAQRGLRAEITLFADAQYVMPSQSTRQAHLDGILANIAGREPHILYLEVANEAWQNGFPGVHGIADLRAFTRHLADRTAVLVAITSNADTSDQGIIALYRDSAADLATVHFSRDTGTKEGGWLPVRDAYRAGDLPGVPPVISNEPIGSGSSVRSEDDPIKLCAAAVFAYLANLPAYVYHSRAGVQGYVGCCPPAGDEVRFEDTAGINAYQHLRQILPPDLASWTRNDGIEPGAPFTVLCDDKPNQYWPDVSGPTNGCDRNIGSSKGDQFVCLPMGILGGGVTIEARRDVRAEVFNPLTGAVVTNLTLNAGKRFTLPLGPGAYIIKGIFQPALGFDRPAKTYAKAPPRTFTRAELTDFQTDLMLFIGDAPELKPHFNADGYDPILRMRNHGDDGQVPHGIVNGTWMWAVNLPNYPEKLWPLAFAQAKKLGWTHWFLHVQRPDIGNGYHGLYPVDAAYAANYGEKLNRAYAALVANGFIPVCAGVAPDAPPAPGFDTAQVLVAMTDWDNSNQADCRIDAIARAFPRALLYYELPQGEYFPKPDACSQVKPDATNGAAWLRSVKQRQPRFVGVVYETDAPRKGVRQAIDEITRAHAFWHDIQEVGPESDTYWKFWDSISFDDQIRYNDALLRGCPWLRGYISGATPHPQPADTQRPSGMLQP